MCVAKYKYIAVQLSLQRRCSLEIACRHHIVAVTQADSPATNGDNLPLRERSTRGAAGEVHVVKDTSCDVYVRTQVSQIIECFPACIDSARTHTHTRMDTCYRNNSTRQFPSSRLVGTRSFFFFPTKK